jgi:hypothetical protein
MQIENCALFFMAKIGKRLENTDVGWPRAEQAAARPQDLLIEIPGRSRSADIEMQCCIVSIKSGSW